VVRRVDNSRVLQISSDRPLNEPFIELLIKAESPTTNVLRQYTILLDPPASRFGDEDDSKTTAKVEAKISSHAVLIPDAPVPEYVPRKSRKSSKHKSRKVTDLASATAESQKTTPAQQVEVGADSYTTQSGDVFGKVAQRYQPEGVSLKKVMAAFYAANPDAFVDGDMNQLKAGQTLRIPTQEAMSGKVSAPKEPASPAPVKSKEQSASVAKPEAAPKFVLKISPGDTDTDAQATADHPADSSVSNNASAQGSPSGNAAAPADLNTPAQPAAIGTEAPAVETPAPTAPVAPAVAQPEVKKPLLVQSAVDNKSFFESLIDNLQWIAMGMAIPLLVFLGLFFLNRRRLANMRVLQESIFEEEDQPYTHPARQSLYSPTNNLGEVLPYIAPSIEATETQGNEAEPNQTVTHDPFSMPDNEMDIHEVDPLVEAEIYMSYGRDEQAETILINALAKIPHKHELSLGLLKIYAERGNKEAFERVARKVYQSAELGGIDDVVIWGKAALLGMKIDPENTLYQIEHVEESQYLAEEEAPQSNASDDSNRQGTIPQEEMDPFAGLEPLPALTEPEDASPEEAEGKPEARNGFNPSAVEPSSMMQFEQVERAQPGEKSNVLEFSLDDFNKSAPEQKTEVHEVDDSLGVGELFPAPRKK
ncbi:MAG: type IV pilus assembly protein FimV, partial [Methylophilaceae bacterium]